MRKYTKSDLENFQPRHDSFVGIDSDGCVFPTMEIKQKQCFHKLIVKHWGLEKIEKYVRETAEFVNLYSRNRGQNRFPCLLLVMELLQERPEVAASGVALPDCSSLKKFITSGVPLSNDELAKAASVDPGLQPLLDWSYAVNADIAQTVKNVPPFPWVRESLEKIKKHSDAICVSQTPTEALVREWEENDLMEYVSIIAGQELGSKTEHLQMAAGGGRYPEGKVLMIGDALGDLRAARATHSCFYPINPGGEAASWQRFYNEAYDKFLTGDYLGAYADGLIAEFERLLPDTPPWKRKS